MDQLGDYMKQLEKADEQRAVKGMPLCARLDGRAFHTFTRGLERPFDVRLTTMMQEVTKQLVNEFHPLLGYTQSDEISLVWYLPEEHCGTYLFDGRYQKLCSVLAAHATGTFRDMLPKMLPEKSGKKPLFDCRVWQVPTIQDAALTFKWRELDAVKNSISMAAQAYFSHKELHKVGSEQKKQMLRYRGKPWESEPGFFRRGSYFKRVNVEVTLDDETLAKIPEKHRTIDKVIRSEIQEVQFPFLNDTDDIVKTLFGDLK